MEFLLKWILFASVQTAATMSPGPAFVVAVRNACVYGRRAGIYTALGFGAGIAVHVLFVLAGISFLIKQSVIAFMVIKYVGAAYLVYIGVKAILARKKAAGDAADGAISQGAHAARKSMGAWKAVRVGFLTNVLNPKAMVFFTAVYTQFLDPATPFMVHMAYGMTSVLIEILWFIGVAMILTKSSIRTRFTKIMHLVERACGGLMVGLGVKLALSK